MKFIRSGILIQIFVGFMLVPAVITSNWTTMPLLRALLTF